MTARERRLALVLFLAVAASRLLLVPGVPWEQDEALFAAAAFDTDLAQHRPHPPGFPAWVAAAKVGLPLAGDPLRWLQTLSAAASAAAAVLLALALRPLTGTPLALAAGAWFAFLPGVWFHAPRAFTSTPATALALGAVVAWRRPGGVGWAGGVALTAAALLVRPVLAPPLLVLAAAAAWLRRERPGRVAAGAVLGAALVTAGFMPLVWDAGGPARFLAAVRAHGGGHAAALHLAPWRPAGLGPVRAAGGPLPAVALVLLAAAGAVSAGRRRATAWGLVAAVTLAWLLLAHNRTYPRYAVPLLALAVSAAALGLRRLAGRWAPALAFAAAAAGAVQGMGAVAAQATGRFPPLEAVAAASRGAGFVVVDGGMSPFGDLLNLARRAPVPVVWRPLVTEGRIPLETLRGRLGFAWADPTPRRWIAPPLRRGLRFTAPAAVAVLAQGRYLVAHAGSGGAVVLAPDDARVGADGALELERPVELLVGGTAPGSRLCVAVRWSGGGGRLVLARADGPGRLERAVPEGPATVCAPAPASSRPWRLRVAALGGRALLRRLWVEDAELGYGPLEVPAQELVPGGLEGLVGAWGLWGVERLGEPPRPGRWSRGRAVLSLPLAPGSVTVALAAPRPGPVRVRLGVPPHPTGVVVEVGPAWTTVEVPVPRAHRRRLELEVELPFVPARHDPRSRDSRELGVVVGWVGITSPRP